jgi:hypothetical protein
MGGVSGKLVWVLLVMCSSWLIAAVHAQQAATTDPIEGIIKARNQIMLLYIYIYT